MDSATVNLAVCLLEDRNIDHTKLQLNDDQCKGHLDGMTHMVTFTFNSSQSCGSEITVSSTLLPLPLYPFLSFIFLHLLFLTSSCPLGPSPPI